MDTFPTTVSYLDARAKEIKENVVYVKQNKGQSREIRDLSLSLSPLLSELDEKYTSLPQATQDTLFRYGTKLKKTYDEALLFIEAQIKVGSVQKFNTSKSSKILLETVSKSLKDAKETLAEALQDHIDPSVCSTPIPATVGIEKHIESMYLAFSTDSYIQALQIGKAVLRKVPKDDAKTKAGVHYDMACTYAKLFNAQNVIIHLQSARVFGFSDFKQIDQDVDFDNVRLQPEFVNFRQMMEYEVLQTESWRELSESVIYKLTALFDQYDEEGTGALSFPQFESLCKGAFAISNTAQVVSFWRESCEDTIEAMNLIEFLNFMAERKDMSSLLPQVFAPLQLKLSHYNGFAPIHTSSLISAIGEEVSFQTVRAEVKPHYLNSFSPFSYSVEGQSCGWMGETPRGNAGKQQNFMEALNCDAAPFSFFTTTDPFANFRW
jgi:hypothetical protein